MRNSGFSTRKTAVNFDAMRHSKADVLVGGGGRIVSAFGDPNLGKCGISAIVIEPVEGFGEGTERGRPACAVTARSDGSIDVESSTCKRCESRERFIHAHINGGVLYARRANKVGGAASRNGGIAACISGSRATAQVQAVVGGTPNAVRAFRISGINKERIDAHISSTAQVALHVGVADDGCRAVRVFYIRIIKRSDLITPNDCIDNSRRRIAIVHCAARKVGGITRKGAACYGSIIMVKIVRTATSISGIVIKQTIGKSASAAAIIINTAAVTRSRIISNNSISDSNITIIVHAAATIISYIISN